jgi:hypothetical protein
VSRQRDYTYIIDPSAPYVVAVKLHVSESGQAAKQTLELLIKNYLTNFRQLLRMLQSQWNGTTVT